MLVIVSTSSGKSTLAGQLVLNLSRDFIELDTINWSPNWTSAGVELLYIRTEEASRSPCWMVAGNYSKTHPVIWPRAEAIIWLDHSIFWWLVRRAWKRIVCKEELWNGNRERLSTQ